MLSVGSLAPEWKGLDQHGKERSSEEFSGKWSLLYFYPKDDTPGCTAEACGFRDKYDELKKHIHVVGVSGDDTESHKKYALKYRLPFTIIADPARTIIRAYGVENNLKAKRSSFLIRPGGEIEKIYPEVDPEIHAAEVEADLDRLGVKKSSRVT